MSEELFYVYCNLDDQDIPVGRLWSHYHNGKESASFKYEESWLKHPNNFELEPFLPLTEGTFHTDSNKSLFASFEDCAPDSWGRLLIKRNEWLHEAYKDLHVSHFLIYSIGLNKFPSLLYLSLKDYHFYLFSYRS